MTEEGPDGGPQDAGQQDGFDRLRQVQWVPVGDDFDDAPEAAAPADDGGDDADLDDPMAAGDDDGPPVGDKGYDVVRIPRALYARLTLPVDCPVRPLGMMDDKFFYLDAIGQLRRVPADKHGQNTLKSLFGNTAYLMLHWPRAKEDGEGGWVATGWKPEECGSALMDSCAKLGVFNPDESVRGAGAWKGTDGELIVHFGKAIGVWPAEGGPPAWHHPCVIDGWIYPTRQALPFPARQPQPEDGAGHEVLHYLMSWHWARPDVDPWLLLGWIVAAYLGASLKWHPLFWAVGDKGTGKSTLLLLIKCLLGRFLLTTANASAAYIYQRVGQDSRAVGIDEAEPDEESKRLQAQMELARAAASGVSIGRGGQDGTPVEFVQRAPYMFCSINMPGLNGADLSRIAVGTLLELGKHEMAEVALMPPEDEREMERIMGPLGRQLLRRVVDGWPRLAAILKAYRGAMKAAGHSGRGADVFGTMLACAHMVLSDAMPTEAELAGWGKRLTASNLAELSTDLAANRACLQHLQSSLLDAKRNGQSYTAGYWIEKLLENQQANDGDISGAKDVRDVLRTHGLDIKPAPQPKDASKVAPAGLYLWVAYRHQGVARLFADSGWKARSGTAGPWVRQLASLDGALQNISFQCQGVGDKAVLIPISYCQETNEDPSAAGRSPDDAQDTCTPATEASARCAADPASSSLDHHPDPFDLGP